MSNIMTIRPPDSLRKHLKWAAKKKGFTLNSFVLQILWEWDKKNENEIRQQEGGKE